MATILLVDDSKTSRKMLRNILESKGHTIIGEATNGEEGVALFEKLHPDVTTMDITMPILDGIQALKKIAVLDFDAKVIMITAAGQKSKMVDAIKYGASDFLAKPYEPDEVIKTIEKVLKH